MKKKRKLPVNHLLSLLLLFVCWQLVAQNKFTAKQWQDDLKFFHSTIHNDYPFLFKKITAADFDKAVAEFNGAIPGMQDHEVMIGFSRMVSLFKYGHTRLGFSDSPIAMHQLPIVLYQFKDGIFITGVHKDYKEALGARVLAIEGMPIEEVLKAVYPAIPVENEQFFKAYGVRYAMFPEVLHAQGITPLLKKTISFTLEKDDASIEVPVTAILDLEIPTAYGVVKEEGDWLEVSAKNNIPYYKKHLEKIYYFDYLADEKTVYVRQSQIQDDPSEDIPTFYKRVFDFIDKNEVEKLILDVRLNGGGNNYKNKPVITGVIKAEKINKPGKFMVIIGRRTFSACQNLVNELSNYTNAVFVGEPTSENINFYGDNRKVQLPNSGLNTYLSFAWWQDKPQWENGPWMAPHIAVETSFDEYRSNQDPVLEAALNFSDNNFILDPMAHLTTLFEAGKVDEVASEASRMVQDPKYQFFNFEGEFNKVGYRLLASGRLEEAIYVLGINAQMFPDSANVWDSLAEAHWKAGNTEKAKELYNKAIAMDPKGSVGENARKMLEAMNRE